MLANHVAWEGYFFLKSGPKKVGAEIPISLIYLMLNAKKICPYNHQRCYLTDNSYLITINNKICEFNSQIDCKKNRFTSGACESKIFHSGAE